MSIGHVAFCNALGRAVDHSAEGAVLLHGPCDAALQWPGAREELPLGRSLAQQALAALDPRNLARIVACVRRRRIRRVYVLSSHPIVVLLALVGPLLGIRLCLHLHDPAPHSSQRGAAGVRWFNRLVTAIPWLRIAVSSEKMADLVLACGLKKRREDLRIVPIPVVLPRSGRIRDRSERDLVLMIGRIESYKGPDLFVDIARRCRDAVSDVEFLIAGPDEHRLVPALEDGCRAAGVRLDVRRLPDATFADYIARAVAVCMPYRDATDSGVAPVAFEFGTPVIAFAVGGLAAEIRPSVNGMLCPPADVEQFAAAIKRLASDPAVFAELSAGAQRSAEAHAPGNVLDAIDAALRA